MAYLSLVLLVLSTLSVSILILYSILVGMVTVEASIPGNSMTAQNTSFSIMAIPSAIISSLSVYATNLSKLKHWKTKIKVMNMYTRCEMIADVEIAHNSRYIGSWNFISNFSETSVIKRVSGEIYNVSGKSFTKVCTLKQISNWPLYKIWYYVRYLINASKIWLPCIVHTNLSINWTKKVSMYKTVHAER